MIVDTVSSIAERLGRDSGAVRALQPAYEWLLQRAYAGHGMPWHVNADPIRIDPAVRRLVPHESEPALAAYLRTHIRPGEFVVDVGSFLGTYAILGARAVGPTGRVLALEPSPFSFEMMTRHLRYNGVAARVDARRVAAGAAAEQRELAMWTAEPYRNMLATSASPTERVTVDIVTLDDLCRGASRPPDWIRIDVQGVELDVLAGAKEIIRAARDRITIIIEVHPDQWPEYGVRSEDVLDAFFALGLDATPLRPRAELFEQGAHVVLKRRAR